MKLHLHTQIAAVSVKGINYLAGLGTIFIFAGIFCLRAAFYQRKYKEESQSVPLKNSSKVILFSASAICLALGILLILKSLKII